jgi:hypothetical protein
MPETRRSRGESKHLQEKAKRWLSAAAAISLLFSAGCAPVSVGAPSHCRTAEESPYVAAIDKQTLFIFLPDETGQATRFIELSDHLSYLSARCHGINAYRGE